MKLNRRNALFALGTIAAGSGTALATGAFSSVNADRTVSINVASDADAVLSLFVDREDEYTGLTDGGSDDVIKLDFRQLNQTARTRFDNALTIENNGSQDVDLAIETSDELEDIIAFTPPLKLLESGGTAVISITVDLRAKSAPSDPTDITITATSS